MGLKLSVAVMLLWLCVFNQQMLFAADKEITQLSDIYSGSSNEIEIRVICHV
ncbi:MAG: hypothetical protein OFPI_05700 [Osedax symbiont Rs2]|nr:MAG: hypothetical protein OFPI_05700 [Osedax symbiont Rs2]